MSGTRFDGVDVAVIETNGRDHHRVRKPQAPQLFRDERRTSLPVLAMVGQQYQRRRSGRSCTP